MNNTKRSSPGEGKLPLKLVAIEIEPRPIFRTRSFRQSWRQKDARSEIADISVKTLRSLYITCLSILSFPLKDFWQTEQNQLMSTPQEQNVDWERGRMLRIYIDFQVIKFYCFPSSSTSFLFSSFLSPSFSFYYFLSYAHSFHSFSPRDSIKDCQLPSLVHFVSISRVVNNNRGFLQLLADCPAYQRQFL